MDADEAIIRGGVWCLIGRGAAHRMRGASTPASLWEKVCPPGTVAVSGQDHKLKIKNQGETPHVNINLKLQNLEC